MGVETTTPPPPTRPPCPCAGQGEKLRHRLPFAIPRQHESEKIYLKTEERKLKAQMKS